jgi:endonuclease/exonuclease/phosphatase family metal-dependent hydrolase
VGRHSVHFSKKGGNIFIATDIKIKDDTIRVFNTHLESVRFAWKDYKFIENLNKEDVEQNEIEGGITILKRLKKAFQQRANQVRLLKDAMRKSPHPVILCGDFNDTPSSYTYGILSRGIKDAFRESGNGFGKTYTGPFPSFRIDYILHDKSFDSREYRTITEKLSDHYPISCRMSLKRK